MNSSWKHQYCIRSWSDVFNTLPLSYNFNFSMIATNYNKSDWKKQQQEIFTKMLYRYLGYFEGKKAAPQTPKVSSPVSYRGLSIGDNLIITEASELKKKKNQDKTLKSFSWSGHSAWSLMVPKGRALRGGSRCKVSLLFLTAFPPFPPNWLFYHYNWDLDIPISLSWNLREGQKLPARGGTQQTLSMMP